MQNILVVAIGGAIGALCRYGASLACTRWFAASTVYATLAVNVIGCFCLGLFAASTAGRSALANAAIAVGFLGGLTTFSTFGLETVRLAQAGSTTAAMANVAANVLLGLAAVAVGLHLGRGL